MTKSFFEVFPDLKLDGELRHLFEDVMVTKVSSNTARDFIRVYIESHHLIEKKHIYQMEASIVTQVFRNRNIQVKLYEKFMLSAQYTPKFLFEEYRDSILEELKAYRHIEYMLLKTAEYEFPEDNVLKLKVRGDAIMQSGKAEVLRILDKIFHERCQIPVQIEVEDKPPEKSKELERRELKMQQQITWMVDNIQAAQSANSQNSDAIMESDNGELPWDDNASGKLAEPPQKKDSKPADKKPEEKKFDGFKKKEGFRRSFTPRKSDNPNVIFGREIYDEEEVLSIRQIEDEMGEVVIRGKILGVEQREIRGEKTILSISVTDFTDTIVMKMFVKNENLPELLERIKKGNFILVKGIAMLDKFDHEVTIQSINGIMAIPDFTTSRMDNAVEKRVELHCHTKMSDMDAVSDIGSIMKQAMKWGHKALAITDHGVVQAFTEASHALPKDTDFKIIYGVEGYIVDDIKELVENSKNQSLHDTYVVFDLETTGFSPEKNKIIEIGAVKVENGKITDRFSEFVNPQEPIPFRIEQLTGIKDSMVMDADTIENILPAFMEFCGDAVMTAHNAEFDMSFIKYNCEKLGIKKEFTIVDTVAISRILQPHLKKHTLDTVAKDLGVSLENHHRAVDDAEATAGIFLKFIEMLEEKDIKNLDKLNEQSYMSDKKIKKLPTYHAIFLATNDIGRINLYRLVSLSHLEYFNRRPRIPKSVFNKYREGILLGSACEAGELFQAILYGRSDAEITRLVHYYDYLEIQPVGNNMFMLESDKYPPNTVEDLQELNRKIVKLGEDFHKLVVATCDVHFLNPEDEVYRRIIMAGKGFADADNQPPLYLHTTDEMLEEFKYLGSEKAEEVVITNPNKIADMCEKIDPVRPDKCPPVIEDSDKTLREICYRTATAMYGEDLPEIVKERLERELNSIISNGFAVMYIIAQKLVWKSNEDGYLVGSRGSVGSSFVATMSGVTEVNPLPPHYYCKNCHYSDFDSPEVKQYAADGLAGCDMVDKICPNCGEKLEKDGFDIPFETFLGFKGNKEPDIDLNFSGDYQSKAHRYTEVIFGAGQTYRAGTIGTLADKNAFGFVKKYYEERGIVRRKCEIERVASGCVGVRRTTGQHPGGIIVLPYGEEIYSFTPVQHPANDMTTDTVTTHFDYHSIDHNLLKLDILGHDDPTMIRMLEDLTGLDAKKIPLDNKEVMSLFQNTTALGVTPEELNGCQLGSLGIPEFGTDFAMQMLIDTKPKAFSDLVRIAGLSHGTDVWLGNAQTLLQEGKATISTAICTRDDIMTFLIYKGVESELSFTIMESVRKGKGLKPEWEAVMKEHDVPDWYIWSCKKIKYMFPKAHAVAYVMMAWRIAYCKVFYPLAYYAAFFSIRAKAFDYSLMCFGKKALEEHIKDYKNRADALTPVEQDKLRDMRIVQEMYARGFEFLPIDIMTSKAKRFQIIDGKLLPPINAVAGLGDKAAEGIEDAAKDGAFMSKDELRERAKIGKSNIELLTSLGILDNLPDSNQLSIFDYMKA